MLVIIHALGNHRRNTGASSTRVILRQTAQGRTAGEPINKLAFAVSAGLRLRIDPGHRIRLLHTMSNSNRAKLFVMMGLQFFIWGCWLPLIYGDLPSLGFTPAQQSWILNAFPIAAVVGLFFSNQYADRRFAAEKFFGFSHTDSSSPPSIFSWTSISRRTYGPALKACSMPSSWVRVRWRPTRSART